MEVVHKSFQQYFHNVSLKFLQLRAHYSFNVTTSSLLTFLFVRNGDIEIQKLLLFKGCFSADFAKHCFLAVFVRFLYLFFICLRAKKFSLDGHLLYFFLILDLVIIALLSSFVIKRVWFLLTCFCFSGAWLSKVDHVCFLSHHI